MALYLEYPAQYNDLKVQEKGDPIANTEGSKAYKDNIIGDWEKRRQGEVISDIQQTKKSTENIPAQDPEARKENKKKPREDCEPPYYHLIRFISYLVHLINHQGYKDSHSPDQKYEISHFFQSR